MLKNLDELKEKDVRALDYNETLDLIDILENNPLSQSGLIAATEKYETYISFINIIKERVENNSFCELKTKKSKTEIINRLNQIKDKMSYFIGLVNVMRSNLLQIETQLKLSQQEINTKVEESQAILKQEVDNTVTQVQDKVKEAENKLDVSEHNILTHVLTLLGVFSAIIITIMSVVITSSSWLNNADSYEAIIAFVAPTLVIIFAVTVLLSLVYFFHERNNYKDKDQRKGVYPFFGFVALIIIVIVLIVGWLAYLQAISCKATHTRYVIEREAYEVFQDKENESTYLKFIYEEKEYVFPYEEKILHDEKLYFCIQHQELE